MTDDQFILVMAQVYQKNQLYFNALFGKYADWDYLYQLAASIKFDLPELHLSNQEKVKNYLIEFHLSTIMTVFRQWLEQGQDLSVEELMMLIKNLYMNGISGVLSSPLTSSTPKLK